MNTDTGVIYRGDAAIAEAQQRGEPVVIVSEQVAARMEQANRAASRRRSARKAERQNRKRGRR
jgi:hypothetical protein